VIVLDLNLPKKNGHEILAAIRRQADLNHIPTLMFTTSLQSHDREKALSLGARGYFNKTAGMDGFNAIAAEVAKYAFRRKAAEV